MNGRAYTRALTAALIILVSSGAAAQNIVIVLSWDGVRHDYPDRSTYPGLKRMEQTGMQGRLTPIYPSTTFPTHVTMATGTYPDVHGIVANDYFDQKKKKLHKYADDTDLLDAEPVWITAQRQGVDAATYYWVGSYKDWRGQGHRYRMAPFSPKITESEKVDQILAWLDLPEDKRPGLIMGYWAGTDDVGHGSGPDSPEIAVQLASQDQQLVRLLEGLDQRQLWDVTTLMLVSDHGMASVSDWIDVGKALVQANIAATVLGGPVAEVYLDDAAHLDAALSVVRRLEHINVYRRAEIPVEFRLAHPARTGDLLVTTAPPYTVGEPNPDASRRSRGMHGYPPSLDDMKAIIFAMGRNVKADIGVHEYRQVDLAATITHLLGIEAPLQSEGEVMQWVTRH